jgi:hypothetical protein
LENTHTFRGDGGPWDSRSGLPNSIFGSGVAPAAAKPDVSPAVAATDSRRNFLLDFFMDGTRMDYDDYDWD